MKARDGVVILTLSLSAIGCLALVPSVGADSLAAIPSTQWPMAHYVTQRTDLTPSVRKSFSEDDLVVALDDFTYTGLIKASATNPYASPTRVPPTPTKSVTRARSVAGKK